MMLYVRRTDDGKLVDIDQMVESREHLVRQQRLLFLSGAITGEIEIVALLFALDSLSHKPIKLVITSPGGDLDGAFLLYDTLKLIKSPVWTLGRFCASAAVLLLSAGKERYLLPHSKVMLHLPAGQAVGDARDWEIQHREMKKYKDKMVDILIECGAKRSHEEILKDIDRDFWLEPREAIEYGLADEVITTEVMKSWLK